jgi:hypothetical protein
VRVCVDVGVLVPMFPGGGREGPGWLESYIYSPLAERLLLEAWVEIIGRKEIESLALHRHVLFTSVSRPLSGRSIEVHYN